MRQDWLALIISYVYVFAAIGIGEGLITVAVLVFLRATRPDLLTLSRATAQA